MASINSPSDSKIHAKEPYSINSAWSLNFCFRKEAMQFIILLSVLIRTFFPKQPPSQTSRFCFIFICSDEDKLSPHFFPDTWVSTKLSQVSTNSEHWAWDVFKACVFQQIGCCVMLHISRIPLVLMWETLWNFSTSNFASARHPKQICIVANGVFIEVL